MEWIDCITGNCPEPRELAIAGLWFDMAGAVLRYK